MPDEADNHLVGLAVAGGADVGSLWKPRINAILREAMLQKRNAP